MVRNRHYTGSRKFKFTLTPVIQPQLFNPSYSVIKVYSDPSYCFVIATPEYNSKQLAGFFTLSAGSVSCVDLPATLAKTLPRYPVPVALIGRLAVSTCFHRKGLGSILLADACQKVIAASKTLAVVGIVVDAKDSTAVSFYTYFGFMPLAGQPDKLILPSSVFKKVI